MTWGSSDPRIGTDRGPFDLELARVLGPMLEQIPPVRSIDDLIATQGARPGVSIPSNAELSCDGRFIVQERSVANVNGDAEVRLLICRPTVSDAATPAVYHVHGGGMVAGSHRVGLVENPLR